jgi:hypothetical protein
MFSDYFSDTKFNLCEEDDGDGQPGIGDRHGKNAEIKSEFLFRIKRKLADFALPPDFAKIGIIIINEYVFNLLTFSTFATS